MSSIPLRYLTGRLRSIIYTIVKVDGSGRKFVINERKASDIWKQSGSARGDSLDICLCIIKLVGLVRETFWKDDEITECEMN